MTAFWLLIAIPLASAAVLLLLGRRADRWGHLLGVASIAAAFVLGLVYFFQLGDLPADHRPIAAKVSHPKLVAQHGNRRYSGMVVRVGNRPAKERWNAQR